MKVVCADCGTEHESGRAWRERQLFSRGAGGTLGRVKLLRSLNVWLCDACVRKRETGGQESMFEASG